LENKTDNIGREMMYKDQRPQRQKKAVRAALAGKRLGKAERKRQKRFGMRVLI